MTVLSAGAFRRCETGGGRRHFSFFRVGLFPRPAGVLAKICGFLDETAGFAYSRRDRHAFLSES
jgi:hypothetical protein